MRVHIGSDHAGFELKNYLITALTEDGHELVDHWAGGVRRGG
jgi:ribose 5-phosphate isomerase B